MDCPEAFQYLSAYYDGELPPKLADDVERHASDCPRCAAELATFRCLSRAAAQLDQPVAPARVWHQIASTLDAGPSGRAATLPQASRRPRRWLVVGVTALLLIASAIAWQVPWHTHQHQSLAANFGHFLELHGTVPLEAHETLIHNYNGRAVSIEEGIRELKYRPAVANGIPPDYELAGVYLLNMPCCKCLDACYYKKGGGMLCVFEHDEEQRVWFGTRPATDQICHGRPTRIVELEPSLAATWRHGSRYITIVGASDVNEVSRLVAHFESATGTRNE